MRPKFAQNRLTPSTDVPPVARSCATTNTAASSDICSRDFTSHILERSIAAPVIAISGTASNPTIIATEPRFRSLDHVMAAGSLK